MSIALTIFSILAGLAIGLYWMHWFDRVVALKDPNAKTWPWTLVDRVLVNTTCSALWFGGFKGLLAYAALTLALWPIAAGLICLAVYRPHWYTIWSVAKAVFAVAISPIILLVFVLDKSMFIRMMTALWPHLDIYTPESELYLRRWFMTPKGQAYRPRFLHLILLSDDGRDPHDHPGAFSTTILANGYDEEIYFPRGCFRDAEGFHPVPKNVGRIGNPFVRQVRAGQTYDNPEDHTHIVKLIGPTLSWVVGWKKGKPWGFWKLDPTDPSKDEWIDSETYGDKGEERKSWTIDGK